MRISSLYVGMAALSGVLFYNAMPATAVLTQCPPTGFDSGCTLLFTLGSNGSLTTTFDATQGPYDGVEDTLVGVQNNSGGTVFGLRLTSSLPIFAFDLDGAGSGGTNCLNTGGAPYGCQPGPGPTGYEGPGTSFSLTNSFTGTVNFLGGLANGGSLWFSLEGAPDAIQDAGVTATTTVPEPASVLLFGSGFVAIAAWRLRRNH